MKLLIVDDEKELLNALAVILKKNGYTFDLVNDSREVKTYLDEFNYDLIIMDIMMPYLDGYTLVKQIRDEKIDTPIILLSAKSELFDKIKGLDLGADDYITKPFSSEELLARIRVILRRKYGKTDNNLIYKDLILDQDSCILKCNDNSIELSGKEFQIIQLLMLNPTKIYSIDELLEKVWDVNSYPDVSFLWVYISALRKKLDKLNSTLTIKSTRGLGYSLKEK